MLLKCSKQETETILIARFGMLECGFNFKGTQSETCATCNDIDNENHRLNHCERFRAFNLFNSRDEVNFKKIYTSNIEDIRSMLGKLSKVWNTFKGVGSMIEQS